MGPPSYVCEVSDMRNTEELADAVRSAFSPAHCEIQVANVDTDDPVLLVRIMDGSGNEAIQDKISLTLGQYDQLLEHHLLTTRSLVEAHGVRLDPWALRRES
jgi:hypothetical protein